MSAPHKNIDQSIQESSNVKQTLERMKKKLSRFVPEIELPHKAELAFKINQLKHKRNAVILAHNYMEPALYHSVSDYAGDSFKLASISSKSDADIIVFCGVLFMAETAKILNPTRTVLIPSKKAGCSLAESVSAKDVRKLKKQFPDTPVVSYVNTYADVKAETDICCTSSNAAKSINYLMNQGHKRVIFLPDEYMGKNVSQETGIPIVFPSPSGSDDENNPDKYDRVIIGWRGRCEVHEKYTVKDVEDTRKQFPDVVILAHPECSPDVVQRVDFSGGTQAMIDYVRNTTAPQYLLLTECSMGDNIAAENPEKEMLRMCSVRCPHMNLITLEDTLAALEKTQFKVEVPKKIITRARVSLDKMLEIR